MQIEVTREFRDICEQIIGEGLNEEDWAKIESDDMFQSNHYSGGFDSTEMSFCFSYFDEQRDEYWFQLTLPEIAMVAAGRTTLIESRLPN